MGDLLQTIGPYVVLGELGEGAMGRVVQARHVGLNRAVALKVLRAGDLATSDARARFRTEAEATAALEHPHIVPVYEVGEHAGATYLAMKLMPGGNLAERLAEASIDVAEAGAMMRDIARAVAYAHGRGVLHRDLKPANILFDADGRAHLSDFGLSKLLGDDAGLTRSHGVLGTPSYMAPEVARGGGRSATTAADVWGLGAVLYEALSGRPPFTGDSVHEVLRRVAEEEVAPLGLRSRSNPRSVSGGASPRRSGAGSLADLELVCLKCLRRPAEERYPSADALAEDLDRWLAGDPIRARPPTSRELLRGWYRRHRVLAWAVGAVSVALVAGLAGTLWQWRRADRFLRESEAANRGLRETNLRLELARIEDSAAEERRSGGLLEWALLLRGNPGNAAVGMRLWSALSVRRFAWPVLPPLLPAGEGEVYGAAFSADGRRVATTSIDPCRLHVWDVATGARLGWVPHDPDLFALAVDSALRRAVVRTTNGPLGVWDLEAFRELPGPWRATGDVSVAAMHPSGAWAAGGSERGVLHWWGLADGSEVRRTDLAAPIAALAWHPTEPLLACVDGGNRVRLLRGGGGDEVASAESAVGRVWAVAFSARGEHLLLRGAKEVEVWEWRSGSGRGTPARFEVPVMAARLSAGGDRFAVGTADDRVAVYDSRTGAVAGTVSKLPSTPNLVRFAPGDAFVAVAGNDGVVRFLGGDSGAAVYEPIEQGLFAYDAAFGPGELLATVGADHSTRVWSLRQPAFGGATEWGERSGVAAAIAPDGETVVSVGLDGRVTRRRVPDGGVTGETAVGVPGPRTVRLSGGGRWQAVVGSTGVALVDSNDGREVAVLAPTNRIFSLGFDRAERQIAVGVEAEVQVWAIESSDPSLRGRLPVRADAALEFSPDGRRLALVTPAVWGATLWDVATGRAVGDPMRHSGPVDVVRFSPDGRYLATGGQDRKPGLWSATDGRAIRPALDHSSRVHALVFGPRGDLLLAGGEDGLVTRWEVPSGAPAGPPLGVGGTVTSLDLSADGEWLLVGAGDRAALWSLATGLAVSDSVKLPWGVRVRFGRDGRRALLETPVSQWVWRLPLGDRPSDEALIALAQLAANRHLDASGAAVPFDQISLGRVWSVAAPVFEAFFPVQWVKAGLRRPVP